MCKKVTRRRRITRHRHRRHFMNETYKKILTVQDISCVGQCSMTVALPILSACGVETCILPTALLSNHTAKDFNGFTCLDLTDQFLPVFQQWEKNAIKFDGVYTGYLGDERQIDLLTEYFKKLTVADAPFIVDPAMADNGKLYAAFDQKYVEAMKKLCRAADILLPNITEACFLTGFPYSENIDEHNVSDLLSALADQYGACIVLTGVPCDGNRIGIAVCENGKLTEFYKHERLPLSLHGTGDIFSSVFAGVFLKTKDLKAAVKAAADFTVGSIANTLPDPAHRYGAKFETLLSLKI